MRVHCEAAGRLLWFTAAHRCSLEVSWQSLAAADHGLRGTQVATSQCIDYATLLPLSSPKSFVIACGVPDRKFARCRRKGPAPRIGVLHTTQHVTALSMPLILWQGCLGIPRRCIKTSISTMTCDRAHAECMLRTWKIYTTTLQEISVICADRRDDIDHISQ